MLRLSIHSVPGLLADHVLHVQHAIILIVNERFRFTFGNPRICRGFEQSRVCRGMLFIFEVL